MAYNYNAYHTSDSDNYAYQGSIGGNSYGTCAIGTNTTLGNFVGMIRFPSVPINQGVTVNDAILYIYASNVGDSGTMRTQCYGVDEDNTAILTGDPFGRPETTAVTTINDTRPNSGTYEDYIVTDQVNEILARGGWSNGNAMAFKIRNNGSDTNVWISDPSSGSESALFIRLNTLPDFTPDPTSVAPPSFPSIPKYGIKIADKNVKTLPIKKLYYFSGKKELQTLKRGKFDDGSVEQTHHLLPYLPCALGWYESTDGKHICRSSYSGIDVGAGTLFISSNMVSISPETGKSAYYYIFVDPLT